VKDQKCNNENFLFIKNQTNNYHTLFKMHSSAKCHSKQQRAVSQCTFISEAHQLSAKSQNHNAHFHTDKEAQLGHLIGQWAALHRQSLNYNTVTNCIPCLHE